MDGTPGEDTGSTLPDFSAGSRFAGYRLVEQVRSGGMAVVFRAIDERLGRQVALKVMSAELASDETFRLRFVRESEAAARVDDPHLIPIYAAGQADGILFIAMRYVAGGDAQSLVAREGPLPGGRAASIISQVASALDAAHAADLVHRDVKPANILLDVRPDRPDHAYLADFGVSRRVQSLARLTGTGQFIGTVYYAAPEQIRGEKVGGRADQYALACTAFELLSGRPPFYREDAPAAMWAQMTELPPSLTSQRADFPSAVDAVFAKALAKDPNGRFATCREFAEALRDALGLVPYNAGSLGTRTESSSSPQVQRQSAPPDSGRAAMAQGKQYQPTQDAEREVYDLTGPEDLAEQEPHDTEHAYEPDLPGAAVAEPQVSAQAWTGIPNSGIRTTSNGNSERHNASADAGSDPDLAASVRFYSTDRGPGKLMKRLPQFADERYRRLARAAVNVDDVEPALELVEISRRYHHLEGEACWLALAERSYNSYPDITFQLANLYHQVGLDELARSFTIRAALGGHDEAVSEFLSWRPDIRQATVAKFSAIRNAYEVLLSAADHGSVNAVREVGSEAFTAGNYKGAVTYLRNPALTGEPRVMYMLGASLLSLGQRRKGRMYLRKAGQHDDNDAKFYFARTSISNRPIKLLVNQAISDSDDEAVPRSDPAAVRFLLELADCCSERRLIGTEIACLQRAAALGDDTAMIRLGRIYLDLRQLKEASKWFEKGWRGEIPDDASREIAFRLGCGLHWAGDQQSSERWLEAAAQKGHPAASKIRAGLAPTPRMQRRQRRSRLFFGIRRIAQAIVDLNLDSHALFILGVAVGVAGLAGAGGGIWLFLGNLISFLHHGINGINALAYQLAGIIIFFIGASLLYACGALLGISMDSRQERRQRRQHQK